MYDFYFGSMDEILENEGKYLLFVKRMLHRWANGIPDSELSLLLKCFNDEAFVAIDDANYTNKSVNFAYINMFRKKVGLGEIVDKPDNICRNYYSEVNDFLTKNCKKVEKIDDKYKKMFKDDIFFSYYSTDKKVMNKMGMEKLNDLEHRFDAWKIHL